MNKKRTIAVLGLGLIPAMLYGERKPQFAPLASCYSGPVDSGGKAVVPPRILHSVDPDYTESARAERIQGTVLLQIVLTPDGKVCPERVVRGLTFELDQNAAKALERWTFKPAERDGKPVASRLNVEVVFRLY